MEFLKYEPEFSPISVFITRFFDNKSKKLVYEQETKFPIPTLITDDNIEIFEKEYLVKERKFAFNEDAFMTIYYLEELVYRSIT
ncbi:hypothetical protein [Paenibacillus durus]|uniref:Uncharacterized protein n=1 Tax=Paenibacillus durus ATCC 35681 TaxID=1333534 RepID=A0A0F7CJR3_PAEDU|nr:hypothetical protein [Paenibacillus durus]AKG36406.1 hypothetical protein VK70_19180 [Paenibacillus durus ATCC 35681]